MNAVAVAEQPPTAAAIVDDVIARGDLSKLTPEQRVVYYHRVCHSLGLNPLTQPFIYVTLQGKLQLYARKDCADQLRKINGINIEIADRTVHNDLLTVHVRATDKTGRTDEDFGAVSIGNLKGEAAANAFMKAVTKAKRRVTLSISGLGFAGDGDDDFDGVVPSPSFAPTSLPEAQIAAPPEPEWIEPYQLVPPGVDATNELWRAWASDFIAMIRASKSLAEIERWLQYNDGTLKNMRECEPKMSTMLDNAISQQKLSRAEKVDAAG